CRYDEKYKFHFLSSLSFVNPVHNGNQIPEGNERTRSKNKYQDAITLNELESCNGTTAKNFADCPKHPQGPCKTEPHPGTVNKRRPDSILAGIRLRTSKDYTVHHNQRNEYPQSLIKRRNISLHYL